MARRINRHRIPTHAKPSDKWAQTKTVQDWTREACLAVNVDWSTRFVFRSRTIEGEAVHDEEFAKRKPIDKVWLTKEYPSRSWPIETVLQWHREMHQPKMFNSMDAFVWARLKLDMTTAKKVHNLIRWIHSVNGFVRFQTKFIENVRGIVTLPHFFEDRPRKNVVLFCRVSLFVVFRVGPSSVEEYCFPLILASWTHESSRFAWNMTPKICFIVVLNSL